VVPVRSSGCKDDRRQVVDENAIAFLARAEDLLGLLALVDVLLEEELQSFAIRRELRDGGIALANCLSRRPHLPAKRDQSDGRENGSDERGGQLYGFQPHATVTTPTLLPEPSRWAKPWIG
jgi:hypothetical protein